MALTPTHEPGNKVIQAEDPKSPEPTDNKDEVICENGGHMVKLENGSPRRAGNLNGIIRTLRLLRTWAMGHTAPEPKQQDEFLQKFGMGGPGGEACTSSSEASGANMKRTIQERWDGLIIETSSDTFYYWVGLLSFLTFYNCVILVMRAAFSQIHEAYYRIWLGIDYLIDSIFIIDIIVSSKTGYLEQGLLVRDVVKLRKNYTSDYKFKLDIASIIPFDIFYLVPQLGHQSTWLRFNRLIKVYRVFEFFDRTETRTNFPNLFRICSLVLYIIIIIHLNGCLFFAISKTIGLGSDSWVYPPRQNEVVDDDMSINVTAMWDMFHVKYIYCFYWSTLTLTTIGETPRPVQDVEFVFVTIDFLVGVLIFATIVGNVGSMITNMNAAKSEFQMRMDGVKRYMEFRKVSKELEHRVVRWFDYLWCNKQSLDEETILATLPDKLKAEIAIHVHFETLKRVSIFQDCEPGLLIELVLKLKLQVFSPGDYICRKGDIGKEMYIVKRGKLSVVADDGKTVFVTLGEGSVFGEISILNIAGNKTGNRRTANVRSIGYSDLFCLSKDDLWDALMEYPDAKQILMQRGGDILRKDNLLDEDALKAAQQKKEDLGEKVNRIDGTMDTLETRLARLLTDFNVTQQTLKRRITFLEQKIEGKDGYQSDETSEEL